MPSCCTPATGSWIVNNSNFLHVITLGYNSLIEREAGAPHIGNALGLEVMPHGSEIPHPTVEHAWRVPPHLHLARTHEPDRDSRAPAGGLAQAQPPAHRVRAGGSSRRPQKGGLR